MNDMMENLLLFRDGSGQVTVEAILLCLLATFVMSQVVAWVYVWTHRGISYSASMAQSLVVLALIVALVMLVVGNNIARAFGLFGALALIRFRTPVKDARDTVFLFLSVALGIAAGTGNLVAGAVGTLVICAIFIYLSMTRFGNIMNHDGLFRFRIPLGGSTEKRMQEVLKRYCTRSKLVHMRAVGPDNITEYAFQVKLVDPRYSTQLVAEMEGIEGTSDLSLLMQDQEAQP